MDFSVCDIFLYILEYKNEDGKFSSNLDVGGGYDVIISDEPAGSPCALPARRQTFFPYPTGSQRQDRRPFHKAYVNLAFNPL
jgi:hypothetical protein